MDTRTLPGSTVIFVLLEKKRKKKWPYLKTLLWSISVFLPHFSENSWMRPPPGGGQRPGVWPRVLLVFPLDTVTGRCAPPSPYLHSSSFPKRRLHHLEKWWRGNKGVPAGWSGKEEGRKEGECLSRARGGRRAQKIEAVRARDGGGERLSSLLYRVSRRFCSPFLSTTRFFSIESSRDSQCLAARFRIRRSSDLPTALRAWIMTYRLFFPSWGFGAAWGVAKACLVVRLFLKARTVWSLAPCFWEQWHSCPGWQGPPGVWKLPEALAWLLPEHLKPSGN